MATISFNAPRDASTLANFLLWAKGFSDALVSLGLTRTSDTTNVNWTGLSSVPTSSAPAIEFFNFADSYNSTDPIILRVKYYATSSIPYMTFTIGEATDGAGAFVGATSSEVSNNSNSLSTSLFPCYLSFNPGMLTWGMFVTASSTTDTGVFGGCIERFRTTAGAIDPTGLMAAFFGYNVASNLCSSSPRGWLVFRVSKTSNAPAQYWNNAGASGAYRFEFHIAKWLANQSTLCGGNTIAYPFFMLGASGLRSPGISLMALTQYDTPVQDVTFTATIYGTSHTYKLIWFYGYTAWYLFNLGAGGIAILFE